MFYGVCLADSIVFRADILSKECARKEQGRPRKLLASCGLYYRRILTSKECARSVQGIRIATNLHSRVDGTIQVYIPFNIIYIMRIYRD